MEFSVVFNDFMKQACPQAFRKNLEFIRPAISSNWRKIRILENKMSFGKGMVAPELAFLLVGEIVVTDQNENSSLSEYESFIRMIII